MKPIKHLYIIIGMALALSAVLVATVVKQSSSLERSAEDVTDLDEELTTKELFRAQLPYSTEHFRVTYQNYYGNYLIVPQIPFDDSQPPTYFFQTYWNDYEVRANEALEWIRSQGIDPKTLVLEWWGAGWWPPGKTITVQ